MNMPTKPHGDLLDEHDEDMKRYKNALKEFNSRTAKRLLKVCKLNGGVFVKVGQQVASQNHVLPKEYTDTLSELQDRAIPVPYKAAKRAVEKELGRPLEELFSEFDTEPIGAASLAQVHHAITKDGREVAVKIQYPHLVNQIGSDLWTVRQAIRAMDYIWELDNEWLMEEAEAALEAELNYHSEKENSRKIERLFENTPSVYVPKVYDDLSSMRVMTMEFIHGTKVTDLKSIVDKLHMKPEDVAYKVSEMFAEMVFCSGFVHCDPHPGNLLVRHNPSNANEPQIVLLDHGLYRQLDDEFRQTFCKLWKALLLRDNELLMDCGEKFKVGPYTKFFPLLFTYRGMNSKNQMGSQMTPEEKKAIREEFKAFDRTKVNEFLQQLPRDMLFVFRSTSMTRSLNKELGGNSRQRFQIFGKYALKGLVQDHANEQKLSTWKSIKWSLDYANLVVRMSLIDWSMLVYQWYNGIEVDPDKNIG